MAPERNRQHKTAAGSLRVVRPDLVAEWTASGLYDPDAADADDRLALLEYLHQRGIPLDEMVSRQRDRTLTNAAVDAVLRPPRALTRAEAAARAGLEPEALDRIWLSFGLPVASPDDARYDAAEATLLAAITQGEQLIGEEAMLGLSRVVGQSLARLAEAAVFGFLVNIEQPMIEQGDAAVQQARSSTDALEALLQLPALTAPLFLRHLDSVVERQRASQDRATFDVFTLAVGFVDLVGYTEWSRSAPRSEQRAALAELEAAAADAIASVGGRLVKYVGDAVMFVTTDLADAVGVARRLCRFVADHPSLTTLRGAVGHGDLLGRDGDYFGPVVNLVARAVALAPPGRVLVTEPVDGLATTPLEPVTLRGFDTPTTLHLVDEPSVRT
jgi:class 3 adenylate cyclase